MSDPIGVVSDGFLAFGSQVVVIGSGTFIADDIDYKCPIKILTRGNEVDVPQAESLRADVGQGSMTLQLPDATTAPPTFGQHTTIKAVGGATVNVKIGEVGQKFIAGGETKIMAQIRQRFATS